MSTGRSLHIGLNNVLMAAYGGQALRVLSCENDALSMQAIASAKKFTKIKTLLTSDATLANVRNEIKAAKSDAKPGDLFLLTFSGHGFARPAKKDETWVLYDGQLIDDEISGLLHSFLSGVRLVVVSESCRSGTIILPPRLEPTLFEKLGQIVRELFGFDNEALVANPIEGTDIKRVPAGLIKSLEDENRDLYRQVESEYKAANSSPMSADVILLAACQENQDAYLTSTHGIFTDKLLSVWNGGGFTGNYDNLFSAIRALMPDLRVQDPNILKIGPNVNNLVSQKVFEI